MNFAIIGATGNVGRKTIEVLEKSKLKIDNLYLVASQKSAGIKLNFRKREILVEQLDNEAQIALNNSDWICLNNNTQYQNTSASHLASSLADEFYHLSPKVKNEFVNKDKTSAIAVAASKNLLRAMIEHSNEENLGFKGYPPELAIYRSLLQQNNIHGKSDTGYQMFGFKDYKDLGLQQMAQEFYSFLDQNSDRKVNLTEILEKWSEPPYGIKLGLVPILAVSFYLARNDKIALFVDEIFRAKESA